ncbi:MAG: N-acetyltransferase [bacterium]
MSAIKIYSFTSNDKNRWKDFVKFPYVHYKNDPYWVPPLISNQKILLNPDKHPFYQHASVNFFLALLDNRVVGRIAAIIDKNHNEVHNETTGFFGFFESIENFQVAEKLFTAAKSWIKNQGMTNFRGPANPCLNEDCGFLTNAFNSPPVIMMPYNPSYYIKFAEKFGFNKAMDLYAYYIDNNKKIPDKLVKVVKIVRKKEKVNIRPFNLKNFSNDAKIVWHIYNKAWEKNWGFVPMTENEYNYLAKNLRQVVEPELALFAEINGRPVGFSLSLPDINQALIHTNGRLFPFGLIKLLWYSKKIDMIRTIIMGVIPEHRNSGIDALFYYETWKNAVKKGYVKDEMSWILENNRMMKRSAEMLGGEIYKTYRLYEMKI